RAGDSEIADLGELRQQELEIVRLKRNVGIEIADDVILEPIDRLPGGVETVRFRREVSVAVRRHIEALDPTQGRGVPVDDLCRTVGRTVIDDVPLDGAHGLGEHGTTWLL